MRYFLIGGGHGAAVASGGVLIDLGYWPVGVIAIASGVLGMAAYLLSLWEVSNARP